MLTVSGGADTLTPPREELLFVSGRSQFEPISPASASATDRPASDPLRRQRPSRTVAGTGLDRDEGRRLRGEAVGPGGGRLLGLGRARRAVAGQFAGPARRRS